MILEAIAAAMASLEGSGLGRAARASSWIYPLANLAHVLGAALLVGAIAAFDLRVLTRGHGISVVAGATIPLAAFGLALQAASGVVLLAPEATALWRNPAFLFKAAVLALGLANVVLVHRLHGRALREGGPFEGARPFAAVSLASWVLVLLAGRAIAYV
jgi:hypothetical protein